jgi:hypothetical protein
MDRYLGLLLLACTAGVSPVCSSVAPTDSHSVSLEVAPLFACLNQHGDSG